MPTDKDRRDLFAAFAMMGFLAYGGTQKQLAADAFKIADEMLKEAAKSETV